MPAALSESMSCRACSRRFRPPTSFFIRARGAGSDFIGWLDLPVNYDKEEFARIKAAAERIKSSCDILIVIGIGGSISGPEPPLNSSNHRFTTILKRTLPTYTFGQFHKLLRPCRDPFPL